MKYDLISHAKTVNALGGSVCAMEHQLGRKAFVESFSRGATESMKYMLDALGTSRTEPTESIRQALLVYMSAKDYMDSKRQLAIKLLTGSNLATLTTADSVAASVIRSIGLNQAMPADRILQPLVADNTRQFDTYEMEFCYLDDSQLQELSWDDFHRNYSLDGYIDGQIVARCLISPVRLPTTISKILDEIRMCYGFGQLVAIYGLCRGLVETAITDVCVRIGALTKAQLDSDYFFKDFPPAKRINWTLRGSDRSEAFAIYTVTSRVIHGSKSPDKTQDIIRRSIALVERIYSRHAQHLVSNRNA